MVRDAHPKDMSADEFDALFQSLSTWGRWGAGDQRGALAHLTPQSIATTATLVRDGVSVTLSLPLATEASSYGPQPARHHMTRLPEGASGSRRSLGFAKDYVGVDYHNEGHTHIDALCHIAYEGLLYNGAPASSVTSTGATVNAIDILKDGLVGRGVLLDIPRLHGVPWLEPGQAIHRQDLEAAEHEQGITVQAGDILLVRTGHARRLHELGPWDSSQAKAGLHPDTMSLLAERGVCALGSDGNSDTAPSPVEGVPFPIHVLTLNAMGVHLLDYLQFEDVVEVCERTGRWEFLLVVAPLRVVGGTGSPINPIALF